MWRLAICAVFLLSACDRNRTAVEDLILESKAVVDRRWTPPICFLANDYYGFNGGPALTTIPCESVVNSKQEVITIGQAPNQGCSQCNSGKCWPTPVCREAE